MPQDKVQFRIAAAKELARLEVARAIVRESIGALDVLSSHAADQAAQAADRLKAAIDHVHAAVTREG